MERDTLRANMYNTVTVCTGLPEVDTSHTAIVSQGNSYRCRNIPIKFTRRTERQGNSPQQGMRNQPTNKQVKGVTSSLTDILVNRSSARSSLRVYTLMASHSYHKLYTTGRYSSYGLIHDVYTCTVCCQCGSLPDQSL